MLSELVLLFLVCISQLFSVAFDKCPNLLYMCNPITLEYVELPYQPTCDGIFGFGVSKFSRKYKVLCVSNQCHVM